MHVTATALTVLVAFLPSALAAPASTGTTVSVSFDPSYDVGSNSLAMTACSDGAHGLLTKGFSTFSSLHQFPYIGGAGIIPGWNSDQCGTCWQLTYGAKSITVLVVDHADLGTWNIALAAMNDLTGGQAEQLGRIDAAVTPGSCGL